MGVRDGARDETGGGGARLVGQRPQSRGPDASRQGRRREGGSVAGPQPAEEANPLRRRNPLLSRHERAAPSAPSAAVAEASRHDESLRRDNEAAMMMAVARGEWRGPSMPAQPPPPPPHYPEYAQHGAQHGAQQQQQYPYPQQAQYSQQQQQYQQAQQQIQQQAQQIQQLQYMNAMAAYGGSVSVGAVSGAQLGAFPGGLGGGYGGGVLGYAGGALAYPAGLAPPTAGGPIGGGLVGGLPIGSPPVFASYDGGSFASNGGGGLLPWAAQAPQLQPPSTALSAPANLQPVRSSQSKPRKLPSSTAGNGFGAQPRPPSSASSRNGAGGGVNAFAAQEAERQRQYLQQIELRQQHALQRLGAGGGAYDRLSAAGMPMP